MNCPSCSKPGFKLSEHIDKRKGLASLLFVSCTCGYQYEFRTSAVYDHSYDVNKRMVYAMRNCGQGYSGIEKSTSDEYPQADDAQQLWQNSYSGKKEKERGQRWGQRGNTLWCRGILVYICTKLWHCLLYIGSPTIIFLKKFRCSFFKDVFLSLYFLKLPGKVSAERHVWLI